MKKTMIYLLMCLLMVSLAFAGSITRTISPQDDGSYMVTLSIQHSDAETALLIEEDVIEGAVVKSASDGGDFLTNPKKVFWVFIESMPVSSVNYVIDRVGTFSGSSMFEGQTAPSTIQGQTVYLITITLPEIIPEPMSQSTALIIVGSLIILFFVFRGSYSRRKPRLFNLKSWKRFLYVNKEGTVIGIIIGVGLVLLKHYNLINFSFLTPIYFTSLLINLIVWGGAYMIVGAFIDSIIRPNK